MDNTFERISSSEEETDSSEESGDEIKKIIHYEHFMNQQKKSEYEKNRNRLFTKDLVRKTIVIDSHNYFQPDNFSTSNFNVLFDFENSTGNSTVTTNYDIYKNVIGFRLLSTTIRTPPFNVNDTNNIIVYRIGSSATLNQIYIQPGVYNMTQLADVFQRYHEAYTGRVVDGTPIAIDVATYSQYSVYSEQKADGTFPYPNDPDYITDSGTDGFPIHAAAQSGMDSDGVWGNGGDGPGNGTFSASPEPTFVPSDYSFSATFLDPDTKDRGGEFVKSMAYEIKFNHSSSSDRITFLWDYNNRTRGAARLFGFLPKESTTGYPRLDNGGVIPSTEKTIYSDRSPDVSSHYVDLVIPDIPSIACKKNSFGRNILERIQLNAGHGQYLHFHPVKDESIIQNYFNPLRLHRLTIQLYASNNELYDSRNSDNSFEFEITMVKDKKLLH